VDLPFEGISFLDGGELLTPYEFHGTTRAGVRSGEDSYLVFVNSPLEVCGRANVVCAVSTSKEIGPAHQIIVPC